MSFRYEQRYPQAAMGNSSPTQISPPGSHASRRTKIRITLFVHLAASMSALVSMKHTAPLELAIAVLCAVVSLLSCLVVFGKPPRSSSKLDISTSTPTAILRGLAFAGGSFFASFVLLQACTRLPTQHPVADWDRESVENSYDDLVAENREEEALSLLDTRIKHTASRDWKREMAQHLVDKFTERGRTGDDSRQRVRALKRAIELGKQFHLNTDRAVEHMRKIEEDRAHADKMTNRFEALQKQVADLVARSQFNHVVSLLEPQLAKADKNDSQARPIVELLLQTLVAWGDSLDSQSEREDKYSQAAKLATQWGVDGTVPTARLAIASAERTTQPTDLPQDLEIRLVRTSQENRAAAADIDFTITTSSGKFIPGLREKDFLCHAGGQPVSRYVIHENRLTRTTKRASIVIGVETSRANQRSLQSLEEKVVQLVGLAGESSRHRLYAFNEFVHPLADWARDAQQIRRALHAAPRGDQSALKEMVAVAAATLRDAPGDKVLLLLATGRDTAPSRLTDQAVKDLVIGNGIRLFVLVVGDRGAASPWLRDIVAMSHGEAFEVGQDEGLRAHFARLGGSSVLPTYRLTLLEKSELRWPVEIFAGRRPNVLTLRVDQTSLAVSSR